jgi:carbonic anhydrase
MHKISKLLEFITHKGDRITLKDGLNPTMLLPEDKAYWTYEGSLTTPPLTESVTWIVFKEPIEVSKEQFEQFRQLRCYDFKDQNPGDEFEGQVINNYRPPVEIGNREIRDFCRH